MAKCRTSGEAAPQTKNGLYAGIEICVYMRGWGGDPSVWTQTAPRRLTVGQRPLFGGGGGGGYGSEVTMARLHIEPANRSSGPQRNCPMSVGAGGGGAIRDGQGLCL